MKLIRYLAASAAIAVTLALGAACGDDDDNTPSGATPAATNAPATNVTPFPQPEVVGNRIQSPAKGYAADFPAGWNVRPNHIQTFDASVDAIFEPLKTGAGFQPNIAITCLVDRPDTHEELLSFAKTNTIRQGLNQNIQVSTRMIAGVEASVLSYINVSQATASADLRLDKQDFLFRGPKCDYTITTTALEGQREPFQPQFDAFVDSFQFID